MTTPTATTTTVLKYRYKGASMSPIYLQFVPCKWPEFFAYPEEVTGKWVQRII